MSLTVFFLSACYLYVHGARGSLVDWSTVVQARKSRVLFSMRSLDFFFFFLSPNLPKSSSRTMALGSTQAPTEMRTGNFPGSKSWSARKTDNLIAIYEPVV
jgi:hypothetical protein